MGKVLKSIRIVLVIAITLTTVSIWFNSGAEALADVQDNQSSRRLGGNTASLGKISLSEFQNYGLGSKLSQVAELDDVRITCNVSSMIPALVEGVNVTDGVSDDERKAMLYNSWALQNIISCAPSKTTVYLPKGTFYFVSGHLKMADGSDKNERHVIKPVDGVSLVGAGSDENGTNTTLKVFSEDQEFTKNAKAASLGQNSSISGGVDMFFYNDYAAYGFPSQSERDIYLEDVGFYDFIINSEHSRGHTYNTSGKGFMINLFKNCIWDNVVVKNTDGTGFGVDAPVNGKITNSRAEGCGKAAKSTDGGASGFGIGTGYSENESMIISNSIAKNNKKFGFFYEHQGRFNPVDYAAKSAANERAFRVVNCQAEGNMYNYGGLRANDTYYTNSSSIVTGQTVLDVYFSDESRRVAVDNININILPFNDVDNSAYYAQATYWAAKKGITNGVSSHRFGVGQTVLRSDAIVLFWRLADRPGDVLTLSHNNLTGAGNRVQKVDTCFADVPSDAYYAPAVKWAYEQVITVGTKNCSSADAHDGTYSPTQGITRAEFVTMLWRMAGSPSVGKIQEYTDVTDKDAYYYNAVYWASAEGITNGVGDNRFAPDYSCTREQAIAILWRYAQKYRN